MYVVTDQLRKMAATRRSQAEMQRKCKQALANPGLDPIEKMRLQLLERGCNGIKAIGRYVTCHKIIM